MDRSSLQDYTSSERANYSYAASILLHMLKRLVQEWVQAKTESIADSNKTIGV